MKEIERFQIPGLADSYITEDQSGFRAWHNGCTITNHSRNIKTTRAQLFTFVKSRLHKITMDAERALYAMNAAKTKLGNDEFNLGKFSVDNEANGD